MASPTDRELIPLHRVLVEELHAQYPECSIDLSGPEASGPADAASSASPSAGPGSCMESAWVLRFYQELWGLRDSAGKPIERAALCLSGGGIRSATWSLGVVQGLARLGLLRQFDYLSTVSGGGYLGGWLSSWIQREREAAARRGEAEPALAAVAAVEDSLRGPAEDPLLPEAEPIRHLRQFSRYMSPRAGLLSADAWTLVAIFCRNLLLNWLVFFPFLALFLLLPRLGAILVRPNPAWGRPGIALVISVVSGVLAFAYAGANRPSLWAAESGAADGRRARSRWLRSQGGFLWLCLLPLAVHVSASSLYWVWVGGLDAEGVRFLLLGRPLSALPAFTLFGVAMHAAGFLLSLALRPSTRRWGELPAVVFVGGFGGAATYVAARFLSIWVLPKFSPAVGRLIYAACAAPILLLLFLVAAIVFIGLVSRWISDEDFEWLARSGAWLLIWILARLFFSLVVYFGPPLWLVANQGVMAAAGGLSGLITLGIGFGARTGAVEKKGETPSLGGHALRIALGLAAPLFALSILVGVSAFTSLLLTALSTPGGGAHLRSPSVRGLLEVFAATQGRDLALVAGALLLLGLLFGSTVDINRFSLHGAYRDRLVRAYLGASVQSERRDPNPFTGFDQNDNLNLADLAGNRPFHVINAALNLVGGQSLALQDRKAESFTFSALHCGYRVGYRPSAEYGRGPRRPLSLGTAVAISGAAASPNMGHHSSPVITFLLALFNIRLGWWLGNPGAAGRDTFDSSGPGFSPKSLFNEAFGLTDDQRRYVYLSDGGHFENLGLYEMVRRRCHFILVCDGGADGDFAFDDLGNALSKIRIDFGIPIEFPLGLPMRTRPDLRNKSYDPTSAEGEFPTFAVGRIRYSQVDLTRAAADDACEAADGFLLYLKLAVNGSEPADVYHYARSHPTFPHESTGNQLYSEQQFESYRALGAHQVRSLYLRAPTGVAQLWSEAEEQQKTWGKSR